MIVWHNLHEFVSRPSTAMSRPDAVEVGGVVLGITVAHELGVRFIATDDRVREMDQSIWPSVRYATKFVRQLFRSIRSS
jgi:hypothetical protein